jgi:uncharacterized membrane protein YraQ (UPF0718 family)
MFMDSVLDLLNRTVVQVALSLLHNWPFLLASMAIAVTLRHLVDARRVAAFLARHRGAGVFLATAAAVGTPFCSCGTTAVVLGMMASSLPWAPIVAFMVASPLSSPEGMVYTAGLFGWPFAVAIVVASAMLGLVGGAAASALERRRLFEGQARLAPDRPSTRARATTSLPGVTGSSSCGCSAPVVPAPARPAAVRLLDAGRDLVRTGGRLLVIFLGFASIGYLLNNLVPPDWVSALFGSGRAYGVPLAATLGLPLYVSPEAALPMVRALMDSGMSEGAVMAFLIAGSGTSLGAIAGALTIARWRVVALVVGVLWAGAIAVGFGYNLLLAANLLA